MLHLLLVLAEEGTKAADQPQPNPLAQMAPVGIILLVMFYLLVLRPQRRQEQERQSMLSGLKKNDEVLTAGGIYGTVVAVSETEDKVTLRVDDNVRLKVTKASIQRNFTNEEAARAGKETGIKNSKEAAKDGGS